MSTHLLPLSPPQPAKKLRSCLSPSRASRSASPDAPCFITRTVAITTSDNMWPKRKCVRWEGEIGGSDVTCYFATYSACEYDRTPLAPPSEAERSCVLPARGSRCLNFDDDDVEEEEEEEEEEEDEEELLDSDSESHLPRSPFATPEESDSENCVDDEWSDCFARRRMMFARLRPTRDGPQFEGYRSLSSTLVDLLRSVEDDEGEDERVASREQSEDEDENEEDDCVASSLSSSGTLLNSAHPAAMGDLFLRLREDSAESDIGTPSLISSADSESDCYRLASPRGSAIECIAGALPPWKVPTNTSTYNPLEL